MSFTRIICGEAHIQCGLFELFVGVKGKSTCPLKQYSLSDATGVVYNIFTFLERHTCLFCGCQVHEAGHLNCDTKVDHPPVGSIDTGPLRSTV